MKKFFSRFIFLVLLIIFVGSGWMLFQNMEDEYEYHQVEELVEEEKQILIEEDFEFKELAEFNEDTIGWITIDGTEIDYPILQTSDNSYYLTHACSGKKAKCGSIFMDYHNASDFSNQHTIIYGHNMKNGSMFHDLNEYIDQDFFEEHIYIKTYSPNTYRKWVVFSTYSTEPNFNYLQTAFASTEEYANFLDSIIAHSEISNENVDITMEDKILTLSTCSEHLEGGRRVVHAKLVEEVVKEG